ncbi:MAG: hypothetical protein EXQ97_05755 [Alphaproteobacteria bacterium]|nr:hypothetical protein [Alphaproteobacteria bacterium]
MLARRAPPAIIIHSLAQAVATLRAAEAAGRPVAVLSPAGAALHAGPGWWREVERAARAAVPAADAVFVLDCADRPGVAMAALRTGVGVIALTARPEVRRAIAAIAAASGARLARTGRRGALDLAGQRRPGPLVDAFLDRRRS